MKKKRNVLILAALILSMAAGVFGLQVQESRAISMPDVDLNLEGPKNGETSDEIIFKKVDENGEPLAGARFELWRIPSAWIDTDRMEYYVPPGADPEPKLLASWTTPEDGRHTIKIDESNCEDFGLPAVGSPYSNESNKYEYLVIETGMPTGYMSGEKKFLYISADGHWTESDDYIVAGYRVSEADSDPRTLVGNRAAPPPICPPVPPPMQEEINTVLLTNAKAPLKFRKTDALGDDLTGAKMALYKGEEVKEGDTPVAEWVSGEGDTWNGAEGVNEIYIDRPTFPDEVLKKGIARDMSNVGPVIYTLVEKEAPEGYAVAKPVSFRLYPCGKWEYLEGSAPVGGQTSVGGQQTPGTGSGCGSSGASGSNASAASAIPFVHADPVIMVDMRSGAEKGQAGFVISKVDQYNTPLSDVPFAVYGKPVLTVETKVKIKKEWTYPEPKVDIDVPDVDISGPKVDVEPPDVDVPVPGGDGENGSDGQPGADPDPISAFYIDPAVTVRIADERGNVSDIALDPNKSEEVVTLKPGKYRISEVVPEDRSNVAQKAQSYLKAFDILVDETGAVTAAGEVKWSWLRFDRSSGRTGVFPTAGDPDTDAKATVALGENELTITNYAFALEEMHIEL